MSATRKEVEGALKSIEKIHPEFTEYERSKIAHGEKVNILLSIFRICEVYNISLYDIEGILLKYVDEREENKRLIDKF